MIELYISQNNNSQSDAYGEYTREELNKDGKLGWTDKAEAWIHSVLSFRILCLPK